MLRTFVCAALALALFTGSGFGAEKKGKKKKGKGVAGEIVKVDPEKGTLTLKSKSKKGDKETEVKVTDATTITVFSGDEKTELKADKVADLLKKEPFKTGTFVRAQLDEDGSTAKALTIGKAPRKKKGKKAA